MSLVRISFLLFLAVFLIKPATSEDLSGRISVTVDDSGTLTVSSGYLTNYLLRGRDPATNEVGGARILVRNPSALDLSSIVNLEWDGFFPTVEVQFPELSRRETQIDLSAYSFPNDVSWQNSDLVIRGANLSALATDFPETRDEQIDAIVLFLLNTLTVAEVASQTFSSADAVFNSDILDKLVPFAERIQDYQSYLSQGAEVLALYEEFAAVVERATMAAGIDIEANSEAFAAYQYARDFIDAIDALNISVPVSDDQRIARRGTIAKQYERLVESSADDTADAILDRAVDQFVAEYQGAATDDERQRIAEDYLIAPLATAFKVYSEELERQVDSATSASEKEELNDKLRLVRNAHAVAQLARFLFATDDFGELIQEDPALIMSTLWDFAFVVGAELISIDNIEIASKKALQTMTGADGRGAAYGNIRRAADSAKKIFGALELGVSVGNKMIPLIWDLVLGPNYFQTSIIDGRISTLGPTTTVISVSKNGEPFLKVTNATGELQHLVAANPGDELKFQASMYRPDLFNPQRSPWELNFNFLPRTVYQVAFASQNGFIRDRLLCVRKLAGNLDFAIHLRTVFEATSCGGGSWVGFDAFQSKVGSQMIYNSLDELPNEFKVATPVGEISQYLEMIDYTVTGVDNELIQVAYSGLGLNPIIHQFKFVPGNGTAEFTVDLSTLSPDDLTVSVGLDGAVIDNADAITRIEWDWGDGSSSIATGTAVATASNVSHTYTARGFYTITVSLTRASGQVSTFTAQVNVLAPASVLPSPSGFIAIPGDGRVELSWDTVNGAQNYSVYYAREGFGSPPAIANVDSLLGGQRIEQIQSTGLTVQGLENGTQYFFIVTASNESGEGGASIELTAIPSPEISGSSKIFFEGVVEGIIGNVTEIPNTPEYSELRNIASGSPISGVISFGVEGLLDDDPSEVFPILSGSSLEGANSFVIDGRDPNFGISLSFGGFDWNWNGKFLINTDDNESRDIRIFDETGRLIGTSPGQADTILFGTDSRQEENGPDRVEFPVLGDAHVIILSWEQREFSENGSPSLVGSDRLPAIDGDVSFAPDLTSIGVVTGSRETIRMVGDLEVLDASGLTFAVQFSAATRETVFVPIGGSPPSTPLSKGWVSFEGSGGTGAPAIGDPGIPGDGVSVDAQFACSGCPPEWRIREKIFLGDSAAFTLGFYGDYADNFGIDDFAANVLFRGTGFNCRVSYTVDNIGFGVGTLKAAPIVNGIEGDAWVLPRDAIENGAELVRQSKPSTCSSIQTDDAYIELVNIGSRLPSLDGLSIGRGIDAYPSID